MPNTFAEQYALAQEGGFRNRITMALIKVAKTIQAEATTALTLPPGFSPPGAVGDPEKRQLLHNTRASLANSVLHNPETYSERFARAAVLNNTIDNASTDAAIEAEVTALWNAFAVER